MKFDNISSVESVRLGDEVRTHDFVYWGHCIALREPAKYDSTKYDSSSNEDFGGSNEVLVGILIGIFWIRPRANPFIIWVAESQVDIVKRKRVRRVFF